MAGGSLGQAWLEGRSEALDWLPSPTPSLDTRAACVRARTGHPLDPRLVALLAESARGRDAATRGLEALAAGRATAVVTGQQAGLLGGPLFTLHKAFTAVACAEALSRQTGEPCVPIFWIQDEDHDFAEIAVAQWVDDEGGLHAETLADPAPRVSVAERSLGSASALASQVLRSLTCHAEEAFSGWRDPTRTWTRAFTETLLALFRESGLLLLEGRSLAELAAPFHARAFEELDRIDAALKEVGEGLERAGYREQIPRRPGCSLSFHHPDSSSGPRHRLRRRRGRYHLPDRAESISEDQLLDRLRDEPRAFGTSALLRPIVQDGLLPVAAQIVGPGEAAYMAQVRALRPIFGVEEPMIVPRARVRWIPPKLTRRLDALGLTAKEVGASPELEHAVAAETWGGGLLTEVEAVLEAAVASEPRLEREATRTLATLRRGLGRFAARKAKLEALGDAARARRLREARTLLWPQGQPQERWMSLPWLFSSYTPEVVLQALEDAYVPFTSEPLELSP